MADHALTKQNALLSARVHDDAKGISAEKSMTLQKVGMAIGVLADLAHRRGVCGKTRPGRALG